MRLMVNAETGPTRKALTVPASTITTTDYYTDGEPFRIVADPPVSIFGYLCVCQPVVESVLPGSGSD